MSEPDELVEENSVGEVQMAATHAEDALRDLEATMDALNIDRRTSMPQDQNSLEYRLRDAHASLKGAANELHEWGYEK